MATLIAWIKKACPCGRREVETEDKADSGDEINEADAANVEDIVEQVDKADVEETSSLDGIQRATDVLVADEAAGRSKLPPQLSISTRGRVDTGQQVEKKHEHHHRYSRQMPLSLRERESAGMDPLVAAHVHNVNHSPINRLPDELVLQVLRCLGDDQLTMLCLRRVARRFRRIIDDPEIWKVIRVDYLFRRSGHIFEMVDRFPKDLREELWRRIQKDGMCDKCRMLRPSARDNPDSGWLQCLRECLVVSRSPLGLHCDGCSSGGYDAHPCLGRHGAVRLCEHVKISWADMEPYLSEWQQQQDPHDGQACLDGFRVECRNLSHDTRCRAEDPPTWPRASLKTEAHGKSEWVVVLTFEWGPHSGFDVFSLTSEKRAPASEMRTLFQRHRQGAADIFFPSFPQVPLPEMACFRDTECQCLHYEEGGDQRLSAADPSKPTQATLFWSNRPRDFKGHSDAAHIHFRLHGSYRTRELVGIWRHFPIIASDSICLVTQYSRCITVCTRVNGGSVMAVTPGHDWYHAVDPDLSPSRRSPKIPCRDKSCINYYRSPASFACQACQFL